MPPSRGLGGNTTRRRLSISSFPPHASADTSTTSASTTSASATATSATSRRRWLQPLLVAAILVASVNAAPLSPTDMARTLSTTDMNEKAIRAAFAAVVDPVGAWGYDDRADSHAWGSHFSLLFGFGGEGSMSVLYTYPDGEATNISFPHRPATFPAFLAPSSDLPLQGTLVPFVNLPPLNDSTFLSYHDEHGAHPDLVEGEWPAAVLDTLDGREAPERACVPRAWPPIRSTDPIVPNVIALVERGGCDFAMKVRAAQERGAAAVVVGDKKLRDSETDEEGRHRESLLTMFSPEDTSGISIPSVFVSRASYLLLRDLLLNQTVGGSRGVKVDIGAAEDDGSALGSLLTFALLMPTLFLLVTVTAHRVRVARQREANRAPPTVVLSLPERVWTPDIVWEKDSDDSDKDEDAPGENSNAEGNNSADNNGIKAAKVKAVVATGVEGEEVVPLPDVVAVAVLDSGAGDSALADDEAEADETNGERSRPPPVPAKKPTRKRGKERRKSKTKRYYSKDECAICMDNFHRGEIVRILPCGHVFHKDECDEWLLKWRKLCPTCRADVTISACDLSSSTTLTPVVDPEAAPAPGAEVDPSWRQRLQTSIGGVVARVEATAVAVSDSLRAVVRRPAPPTPAEAADERTPLLGP